MNKKWFIQSIILVTSLVTWSCHNEKNPTNTKKDIKNNFDISTLNIISNKDKDNAAERNLYSTTMKELFKASEVRNNLLERHSDLKSYIDYIPYSQLIPLIIKETKLKFISDGWDAFWYAQLEPSSREQVDNILKKVDVNEIFDPINNHEDNLLYMLIYFWYLHHRVNVMFPNINKKDQMLFTFACYNWWENKIWFLYKQAWNPDNWDEFAWYITKDIMWIKDDPIYITDPFYGTPNYKDFFWDISKYQNDSSIITEWKYNNNTIIIKKQKAYIIIRYVEIIKALGEFLQVYKQ